jgi:aryl-alcohol dehydrogenase-like predicted oxidoreductase
LTPWSPLARGILTGSYKGGFDTGSTARSRGTDRKRTQNLYRGEAVFAIAARVQEVARRYSKSAAQIALAWLLGKPGVVAPVIGVSNVAQLDELVEATHLVIDVEERTYLEELYRPVENLLSIGFS